MKKKAKKLLFVVMLLCGIVIVRAASQTVYSNRSYKLSAGAANSYVNRTATYDNAWAGIEPTSITSGTAKTKVVVQKNSNGTLTNKKEKTIAISTSVSTYNNIGAVGKGTWVITNQAFDGSTDFAGWSGAFTLNSVS